MGGLLSTPKTWFPLLRGAYLFLKGLAADYDALTKRIETSPGVPKVNTDPKCLPPYWAIPAAPVARHGEGVALPKDEVDVVIIGSGITGTSVARELLRLANQGDEDRDLKASRGLQVVMLEARDACSGATARNGGHITPNIYNEYSELKKEYGKDTAEQILRFRLAHIRSLITLAEQEGLLRESQARLVEAFDVFMHQDMYKESLNGFREFVKQMPGLADGFVATSAPEAIERLQLVSSIIGLITKPGGSIHPYRLVTGILKNLLTAYPDSFQLYTHTPCTGIMATPGSQSYTVHTPRGDIRARHIIHATNAWCSHLLPGMRGKVIPARTTMTAQRPGQGLHALPPPSTFHNPWFPGARNFVFYPSKDDTVFEYLTQQPPRRASSDSNPPVSQSSSTLHSNGEMMFGGRTGVSFLDNIGVFDDNTTTFADQAHLAGALERYFADTWDEEGSESADGQEPEPGLDSTANNPKWGKGRVKAAWSGILGLSADFMPWVGQVPQSVSGRASPLSGPSSEKPGVFLAPPGEWICAGYTGEGMTHAWLSGRSLARMGVSRCSFGVKFDDITAAEGEWLQPVDFQTEEASQVLKSRFDWRERAKSRRKSDTSALDRVPLTKRVRPAAPSATPIDASTSLAFHRYSAKFMKLLKLEEAEDAASYQHRLATWPIKRLQDEGYCITGLSAYWVTDATQYGRPIANFELGPGIKLPTSKFTNGGEVFISRLDPSVELPMKGSVLSTSDSAIRVCFKHVFDLDETWRIDMGQPAHSFERMRAAVNCFEHDPVELQRTTPDEGGEHVLQGTSIRDILLKSFMDEPSEHGETTTTTDCPVNVAMTTSEDLGCPFQYGGIFKDDQRIQSWARRYSRPDPVVVEGDPPLNGLNPSQIQAMAAMVGERISLVQGPPGTGKTKVIIETIKLLKLHFEVPHPIVVCTYTNVALDNLVEGFDKAQLKPLRIGHQQSVRSDLLEHSLDAQLAQHPLSKDLLEILDEEDSMLAKMDELIKKEAEMAKRTEKYADSDRQPRKDFLARLNNMRTAIMKLSIRQKHWSNKKYIVQQRMLRSTLNASDVVSILFKAKWYAGR
ncbi:hypothetical protein D9619_011769 [Psilocybe cf. subviscida]|uniref:DNA2/NAM7 helicase helicase domain-containing protein n=1 Tax=Psilocybe cf. subviscida TaxID=2480587 RepID=A0A8H5EW38_9AGAR|nr:hypothetical protein D9619_011769 [Psilocybe cf. subviscida]